MSFKIIGEKTRPDKRLCDSCKYSHIVKGPKQSQEIVRCAEGGWEPRIMSFPVVICNQYAAINEMDEYKAEKLGWVLEVKAGKYLGFQPPKKPKYEE